MNRPDLELMKGAIDMHAHTGPALFNRHIDDAAMAQYSIEYGMRGFVLKDHDSTTTCGAYHTNNTYQGVEAFGAIVLNRSVVGLDPYVSQAALHYGAKVVWMPSNHARHHAEYFEMPDYPQFGRLQKQLPGDGIAVFGEEGVTLTKAARTICELVAEHDACLATGHLSLPEIRILQDAALAAGVSPRRFVVTHANWLDVEVQRELMDRGAVVEYVASSCTSPIFWEQQPAELAEWIKTFEGENLVFGSDRGQFAGPPHPEGMRMLVAALLELDVPYEYLEKMLKANPEEVLGLDPGWTPALPGSAVENPAMVQESDR